MPTVTELNHFALLCHDLPRCITFYTRYLGLVHGKPLAGGFGEYLYFPNSNHAVIHMMDIPMAEAVDNSKSKGFQLYATASYDGTPRNTNSVDHLAFTMKHPDFLELIELLKEDQMPFRLGTELEPNILQVWLFDPNGVKIEVNCFPLAEESN